MTITNPTAIKFSNEEMRVGADKLAQAYYFLKRLKDRWNALGMGTLITNTADVIEDGADLDGRPTVTGADENVLYQRFGTFLDDLEANSSTRLKQILKVAVNTNG